MNYELEVKEDSVRFLLEDKSFNYYTNIYTHSRPTEEIVAMVMRQVEKYIIAKEARI